jgi:hypothetical protein
LKSECAGLNRSGPLNNGVQDLQVRSIEYWVSRTYRSGPLNSGCAGGCAEGRKPLGKPKLREGNDFKLDLKIGVTMWIGFIWLSTLITIVMNLLFQRKFGQSLSS